MTRKHFIAIAEALGEIKDKDNREHVAELIAVVCKQSNDLFNKTRFLDHVEYSVER